MHWKKRTRYFDAHSRPPFSKRFCERPWQQPLTSNMSNMRSYDVVCSWHDINLVTTEALVHQSTCVAESHVLICRAWQLSNFCTRQAICAWGFTYTQSTCIFQCHRTPQTYLTEEAKSVRAYVLHVTAYKYISPVILQRITTWLQHGAISTVRRVIFFIAAFDVSDDYEYA